MRRIPHLYFFLFWCKYKPSLLRLKNWNKPAQALAWRAVCMQPSNLVGLDHPTTCLRNEFPRDQYLLTLRRLPNLSITFISFIFIQCPWRFIHDKKSSCRQVKCEDLWKQWKNDLILWGSYLKTLILHSSFYDSGIFGFIPLLNPRQTIIHNALNLKD